MVTEVTLSGVWQIAEFFIVDQKEEDTDVCTNALNAHNSSPLRSRCGFTKKGTIVASESTSSLLADDDATGFTGSSGNLFDLPPTTPPTT